jgi:hypothetical protein
MKFEPARPEATNILAGIGGVSGSGKTYSALLLATGMGGKIAVIDTEKKRALYYAREFSFDHGALDAPFTPSRYMEAITSAGKHVGPGGTVIVDSASHEWEGEGGLRDWAAKRQKDFSERWKGDPEKYTLMAWSEPKLQHQQLVNLVTRTDFNLILCFRAREKIKLVDVKGDDGKTSRKVLPAGIKPISEKDFAFEMVFFAVMSPERPGVPIWTHKNLMRGLTSVFPEGEQITAETGKRLAEWARGEEEVRRWVDRNGEPLGWQHDRIAVALTEFKDLWDKDRVNMTNHRNLKLLGSYLPKVPEGEIRKVAEGWFAEMSKSLETEMKGG